MSFPFAALAVALSLSGADATITPLAGEAIEGRLIALTAGKVGIETTAGRKELSAADLLAVEFSHPLPADKPSVWLELVDGSKLLAESYTAASGKATVHLVGGVQVEVPTRSIVSVRFRGQDGALAEQWQSIVAAQHVADLIVVRKTSMRTVENGDDEPKTVTETALDELDGTLLDVGPDSVQFDFGGDKINVKREKIEGLIYFHPVRRELPPATCRLIDVGGSQWSVRSADLAGDVLKVTTAAGVAAQLPLATLVKLDFSVGNVVNLAEMNPDTGNGQPAVSLQPAAMTTKFGSVFKASKLPPLGTDGFRIASRRYASGLNLHSPALLVYRVPEGFKKLHAVAGVDDSIVAPGEFVFQILGDGKELFRHEFSGSQQRGPVTINLDLTGIKRISLVVDPADGQDIGDQLNLCEARLTK